MGVGRALVIGLTEVDSTCYGGDSYSTGVVGAELDVDRMVGLLDQANFMEIVPLKTSAATAEAIIDGLRRAAQLSTSDDIFVFYCAGHGEQRTNDASGDDEPDGRDETFYSFNRIVVDDEFDEVWRTFPAGARIVMIADCCHSGTLYKMMNDLDRDSRLHATVATVEPPMVARLLHMAAVPDGERSIGYDGGGAFTIEIAKAWANGQFTGTYAELFALVEAATLDRQKSVLETYGPSADTLQAFRAFFP